jgi:hypothetical protein
MLDGQQSGLHPAAADDLKFSRRRFLRGTAQFAAFAGTSLLLPVPAWAGSNQRTRNRPSHPGRYDLRIGATDVTMAGVRRRPG